MGVAQHTLLGLDAAAYVPHELHRGERAWLESNCYVDLWIEVLHALGRDPHACLAFCLATDYEGDQWTFFKPPLADLEALYGIDVQELNVWDVLLRHVVGQVERGRLVTVEVDSFFLPDTAGTTYRTEHGKTTIAVETIDAAGERLGYFHNGGYHALAGEDFRGVLAQTLLPPYCEFVRLGGLRSPEAAEAALLLDEHLARRPRRNPIAAWAAAFAGADKPWLENGSLADFHRYAFATVRQCGAAHELGAIFLRWLEQRGQGRPGFAAAIASLDAIAADAKVMQFKLARAVNGKRAVDVAGVLAQMAASWDTAMAALGAR